MYKFANFLITSSCNLRCKHCYLIKQQDCYIDFNDACDILYGLKLIGIRSVQFSGGECTLHPNFLELLKYAKQLGFSISVFTNGINPLEKYFDYVDYFFLSLDGPEKLHNQIRQNKDAFLLLLRNFEAMKIHNKTFSIQMTLSRINIFSVLSIYDILKPYSKVLRDIRLVKMIPIGEALNIKEEELDQQNLYEIKKYKIKLAELFKFKVPIMDDIYYVNDINTYALNKNKEFPLWINGVNGVAYIYVEKPEFSFPISQMGQDKFLQVNNIVKISIKEKLKNIKLKILSIDDLLYL